MLPTGWQSNGLGTGYYDAGVFLNGHVRFAWIKADAGAGYIRAGDNAAGFNSDIYLYSAGISRDFGKLNASLASEGRRAALIPAANPAEVHADIFWAATRILSNKGDAFKGFTSGGPDFGIESGFVFWL